MQACVCILCKSKVCRAVLSNLCYEFYVHHLVVCKAGKEGRKKGREGGMELGGRERGRGREGGKEGGREIRDGKVGEREGGREGGWRGLFSISEMGWGQGWGLSCVWYIQCM